MNIAISGHLQDSYKGSTIEQCRIAMAIRSFALENRKAKLSIEQFQ